MRTLMLGWEFPPFISGGLGTACYGLTKALDRIGHETTFVLPRAVDRSHASHVKLLSPDITSKLDIARAAYLIHRAESGEPIAQLDNEVIGDIATEEFEHTTFMSVPAKFSSPYGNYSGLSEEQIKILKAEGKNIISENDIDSVTGLKIGDLSIAGADSQKLDSTSGSDEDTEFDSPHAPTRGFLGLSRKQGNDYGGDLINDIKRYAELCVALTRSEEFDVIHAHDWMTFPAGMAVARLTGKPLVVHVHSTEFDRSGENVNQQVYEIERRGMHSAMRVITVSYWTRNIVMHRYAVDSEKIRVVWNGTDQDWQNVEKPRIQSSDKIVLFLGRITMQKGPEYFIAAAKRVLEKLDNVKFIIAGSGDLATRMIEMAAKLGIGHKVLFTGFLRGPDVGRVFKMADCYVMPSVSEPFGLAPLEAMTHDVPVIISRQSGVSECLTHVLKINFWDVDEMANKILAVLRHPPLSQTLQHHGSMELHSLTWDGAAAKCKSVYEEAVAGMKLSVI